MSTRGDRVKEGSLRKLPPLSKNPSRRNFKRRWFILWESCHLTYYKQKDGELISEINLATCTRVQPNYRKDGLTRDGDSAFFMSTDVRDWLFLADNHDEMQAWADAIERLVRVAKGEPPPVQPRPLDTLPKETTPEPEIRPPARLPASPPGLNLGHPALAGNQPHSQSVCESDSPHYMMNRPLPMVPPNEPPRPISTSVLPESRHAPHHMSYMSHGQGHMMKSGPGKSSTLPPVGRTRGPHHDYINADAQLLQNPPALPFFPGPHGPPPPLTRVSTEPVHLRGHFEQLSQLDENYVSFQREELAKRQSANYLRMGSPAQHLGYVNRPPLSATSRARSEDSGMMANQHHAPAGRLSLQWGPSQSFGDEPKPMHGYVNLDPSQLPMSSQVPPEPPPRH